MSLYSDFEMQAIKVWSVVFERKHRLDSPNHPQRREGSVAWYVRTRKPDVVSYIPSSFNYTHWLTLRGRKKRKYGFHP